MAIMLTNEEKQLISEHHHIQAIKMLRERLGLGLVEAKNLVDAYRLGLEQLPQLASVNDFGPLSPAQHTLAQHTLIERLKNVPDFYADAALALFDVLDTTFQLRHRRYALRKIMRG